MAFETGFMTKIWENFKRLLDPSWIVIYAITGEMLSLLIILLEVFLQHIR